MSLAGPCAHLVTGRYSIRLPVVAGEIAEKCDCLGDIGFNVRVDGAGEMIFFFAHIFLPFSAQFWAADAAVTQIQYSPNI